MLRKMLIGMVAVAISVSATGQATVPGLGDTMAPEAAVAAAAANPRLGKRGTFRMLVRSAGTSRGHVFLNSELDYHDSRNLSVDIDVRAAKLLERQLGMPADRFYKGKWIAVHGTARRVAIVFSDDAGAMMRKFYYQTHVPVREPRQVTFASPAAP